MCEKLRSEFGFFVAKQPPEASENVSTRLKVHFLMISNQDKSLLQFNKPQQTLEARIKNLGSSSSARKQNGKQSKPKPFCSITCCKDESQPLLWTIKSSAPLIVFQ